MSSVYTAIFQRSKNGIYCIVLEEREPEDAAIVTGKNKTNLNYQMFQVESLINRFPFWRAVLAILQKMGAVNDRCQIGSGQNPNLSVATYSQCFTRLNKI